jgi:hypothetical protein
VANYNLSVDIDPTDLAVSLGNVTNISAEVTLRGPIGATGATGAAGQGLASGGTTGQYLRKSSSTNYDTGWDTVTSSDITDFDSQVRTSRLDQMAIPTTDINLNSFKISNLSDPSANQDAATKKYVDDHAGSGGGGSTSSFSVTQTAHGFVVGDVLRNAGTANTYAKAQADSAAHAEIVGIVTVVTDANTFSVTTQGIVTAGVPAATAGTVMFLSASTAGALSSTEPSSLGDVSKPLAIVLESSVRMLFSNFRGELINSSSGGGGGAGTISVEEADGAPAVTDVSTIVVTNGTLTDDGGGQVTINTGGSGDASGPASSTDNAITRFDGTTGKLVQNSGATIDDSGNLTANTLSTTDDATTRTNLGLQAKTFLVVGSADADYITDGAADQVQINLAITAASAAGGGIVYVKAGTYDITASITLDDDVMLCGAGSTATTFKNHDNTNMHLISISAVSNVTLRDFEVDGNKANNASQTGHNIRVGSASVNVHLENIYTHDAGLHGFITAYDSSIANENIYINNCRSDNNGVSVDGSGFYFNGNTSVVVTNCTATGNELDGIQWKTTLDLEISNFVSYDNGRDGIFAVDGHANVTNVSSHGNGSIGFHVQGGGVFDPTNNSTVNISNSKFYNNGLSGIRLEDCDGSSVTGVRSYNNGQSGTASAGLYILAAVGNTSNRHRITNSAFYDDQGSPTQDYGIWGAGAGTIDLNSITNCECYSNSTTQFRQDTWSNTNRVVNVLGFNQQNLKAHGNLTTSKTFDRNDGHFQTFTLTGNLTATFTSGKQRGDTMTLQITQDGTGSRIITWPSNFKKAGGTLTLSTAAGAVDTVTMIWDGTNWRELSRAMDLS